MNAGGHGRADPVLQRIERVAVVYCLVAVGLALILRGGRPDAALGVIGGGVLAGAAYWSIRRGVDALLGGLGPDRLARRRGWTLAVGVCAIVGRYALLGFLAYVMIARLRLHPIGLLAGVSSVVAAIAVEALLGMARFRAARRD